MLVNNAQTVRAAESGGHHRRRRRISLADRGTRDAVCHAGIVAASACPRRRHDRELWFEYRDRGERSLRRVCDGERSDPRTVAGGSPGMGTLRHSGQRDCARMHFRRRRRTSATPIRNGSRGWRRAYRLGGWASRSRTSVGPWWRLASDEFTYMSGQTLMLTGGADGRGRTSRPYFRGSKTVSRSTSCRSAMRSQWIHATSSRGSRCSCRDVRVGRQETGREALRAFIIAEASLVLSLDPPDRRPSGGVARAGYGAGSCLLSRRARGRRASGS